MCPEPAGQSCSRTGGTGSSVLLRVARSPVAGCRSSPPSARIDGDRARAARCTTPWLTDPAAARGSRRGRVSPTTTRQAFSLWRTSASTGWPCSAAAARCSRRGTSPASRRGTPRPGRSPPGPCLPVDGPDGRARRPRRSPATRRAPRQAEPRDAPRRRRRLAMPTGRVHADDHRAARPGRTEPVQHVGDRAGGVTFNGGHGQQLLLAVVLPGR